MVEQLLSLIGGTSHAETKETRVCEVEVKCFSGINVSVFSEDYKRKHM